MFDDSTARNLESSIETMTTAHDTHAGGSAVVDAPEHAQPSPAELASAPADHENDTHGHSAAEDAAAENAALASDDFAAALQSFETET